jgi:CheY-like chemotaxis protein
MTAQNMGKKILADSGYDVTTVSNGAAAVKKIAEVKPDVVILDIYMPGYTGLEVCERVRANMDTANLPVLLTVGKMEPYRAEDGAKVRADGVIVKPFEATDLLAVVKKMAEKATLVVRHVAPDPEPEPYPEEEVVGQPEPAMPASVEVPSEIAAAPALAMEEFNTAPAEVPQFKSTIEWTAAPPIAEIPWSFDHTADHTTIPAKPQPESAPVAEAESSEEIEFTSAPRAGYVEVQQAEGLEAGLEAPPTGDIEITTDPGLTNPQEMTEFATSFAQTSPEPPATEEVIAEVPTVEAPGESAWDGWAHAQSEPVPEAKVEAALESEPELEASSEPEPAVEASSNVVEETALETKPVIDDFEAKVTAAMAGFSVEPHAEPKVEQVAAPAEALASPNVDDFDARVAAAMSGFATEPVETAHETVEEAHAQPAEIEAVADDFEARVAAAMSGFATEPMEPEQVVEAHPEPMDEAPAEPAVEEAPVEAIPPSAAQDDFDARLAQALSAFDTAPEVSSQEEASATAPTETPSVQLNEATVLPHEATLSLEEEMRQVLEQHVNRAADETVAPPVPEPVAEVASHPEPAPETGPVNVQGVEPAIIGKFDAAQEPGPPQLPEVAVAAFAAAASAAPVEAAKPGPEKLADAIHRAIDRLKPQLIAEIVKELKGE